MNRLFTISLSLAMFCGPVAFADNPHLAYSPLDGNVRLFPNETLINSFSLQSDSQFNPVFDQTDLIASTFNIPGLVDNTPDAIGWVVAIAAIGPQAWFGERPEDQAGADLGNIFPVGLDEVGLNSLLTNNAWGGPFGTSGAFDLALVPEPNTTVLSITILFLSAARLRPRH